MFQRTTLILAILSLLCAPVLAQGSPDQTTMGKVIRMTDTTVTILTNDEEAKTFRIDESLYPDSLSVGDHVAVRHILGDSSDGELEASEILIGEDVDSIENEVEEEFEEIDRELEEVETEVETTVETVETEIDAEFDTELEPELETETTFETRTRRLPQTASPLAGLAFAGLLSLAGAFGLRSLRRR